MVCTVTSISIHFYKGEITVFCFAIFNQGKDLQALACETVMKTVFCLVSSKWKTLSCSEGTGNAAAMSF